MTNELEGMPGVAAVSAPITKAEEGDVTIVSVTPTSSPASDETDLVAHLRDKAEEIPASSGVTGYVTGQTAINIDTADRLSAALPKYVRARRRAGADVTDGGVPARSSCR